MKKINWKKGVFTFKYRLFDNNVEIGEFNQPTFSSTSIGKIRETKLKFKKEGFFSSEAKIIDLSLNKPIGSIKINSWGNKAEIDINGKKYSWKYNNFWSTKWSISENGKQLISYESSTTKGIVESLKDNEPLLLSGFYVYNYYAMLIIIISVLTIIIVSRN